MTDRNDPSGSTSAGGKIRFFLIRQARSAPVPGGRAPQLVAGEVAVGQQQHPGPQGRQQPPRKPVLAGPFDAVERGVDDRMGAALGQRDQPQLRVAALRHPERSGVGRGVGGVQPGAVPGHQPEPERERARRARHGARPRGAGRTEAQRAWRPGAAVP